ncbi:MAG: hypothetical protein JWP00_2402 [Chloroflexi bacterium]|nr:hypothetical protein [Chloroflexota bacterium]
MAVETIIKGASVIGFDLDGTLFTSYTTQPVPGIARSLSQLPGLGIQQLFIATNQSGPVWRKMLRKKKFPTELRIAEVLLAAVILLKESSGLPVTLLAATHPGLNIPGPPFQWEAAARRYARFLKSELQRRECPATRIEISSDVRWRKPEPEMIGAALNSCKCSPNETIYIGDMPTDEKAARLVGVRFLYTDAWINFLLGLPEGK